MQKFAMENGQVLAGREALADTMGTFSGDRTIAEHAKDTGHTTPIPVDE